MSNFAKPAVILALLLSMLAAPAAFAQTPKPVVVVSISGVDELMGDVDYLTKAAGSEEYGNLFKLLAAPYTVGIDKTKPWGVVLQMTGDEFIPLAFVPVNDLQKVFNALSNNIGEPRAAGGGVFEITQPAPMFVKQGIVDVVLVRSGPEDGREELIEEIRKATDLGAKEAKAAVNELPATLESQVPAKQAMSLKQRLEKAGASVELQGFAFLANESKFLKSLPDDPVKLLDGLNKEYDVAMRAFVQNVPQDKKEMAIEMIRTQQRAALERQLQGKDEDDPEYKLTKRLSESQMKRLIDMINDTNEFTVGWKTDGMAKKTFLDVSLTAKEGTPTARRMKLLHGNESAHSGFELPDAAVTLTITAKMQQDDIDQLTALMDTVKVKAFEEIDKDDDLDTDAKKDKAKEVIGGLIDTLSRTCETGKLDGGAALVLGDKTMSFVAGGQVADAKALEDSLRKLVDLAKDEPDFPGVKFNAQTHRGIAFHTMQVPIPADEEEARDVLGEKLDVVVGTGENAAYLSLGNDAAGLLKKVIDRSSMKQPDAAPMHLNVALTPIFKFASSVQDNPVLELISASLEKSGNDHVVLEASSLPNGVSYRLTVEEGILQAIGQAVKFREGGL